MFSLAYHLQKTMPKFCPSKFRRKKYVQTKWIFRPSKLRRKKQVETPWIFRINKLHRKSGNNVDFSTSEITSKKLLENEVDFFDEPSYIEKVRGNDMEIRRNLVFDVSPSNRRLFDVEFPLRKHYFSKQACKSFMFLVLLNDKKVKL